MRSHAWTEAMINRRVLLAGVAATALAACSDSGAEGTSAGSGATPDVDQTVQTASVDREPAGTVDMAELMQDTGLPEKTLGDPSATVTVVEYASMTCGHCAAFHNTTFKPFKEQYIDTGKVFFVMREFPFDPLAEAAVMLARCSGDRFFPMVDALYASQSYWARAQQPSQALFQISRQAGFTEESFNTCLRDGELLEKIRTSRRRAAEEFAVDSTPTFFINGKRYPGNMSIDVIGALVEAEM